MSTEPIRNKNASAHSLLIAAEFRDLSNPSKVSGSGNGVPITSSSRSEQPRSRGSDKVAGYGPEDVQVIAEGCLGPSARGGGGAESFLSRVALIRPVTMLSAEVFQMSQASEAPRQAEKWNLRTKPVRVRKELEEVVEYLAQRYNLKNEFVRNAALALGLIVVSEGLRSLRGRSFMKDIEFYVKLARLLVLEREKVEDAVRRFTAAEEIFEALAAV